MASIVIPDRPFNGNKAMTEKIAKALKEPVVVEPSVPMKTPRRRFLATETEKEE